MNAQKVIQVVKDNPVIVVGAVLVILMLSRMGSANAIPGEADPDHVVDANKEITLAQISADTALQGKAYDTAVQNASIQSAAAVQLGQIDAQREANSYAFQAQLAGLSAQMNIASATLQKDVTAILAQRDLGLEQTAAQVKIAKMQADAAKNSSNNALLGNVIGAVVGGLF